MDEHDAACAEYSNCVDIAGDRMIDHDATVGEAAAYVGLAHADDRRRQARATLIEKAEQAVVAWREATEADDG